MECNCGGGGGALHSDNNNSICAAPCSVRTPHDANHSGTAAVFRRSQPHGRLLSGLTQPRKVFSTFRRNLLPQTSELTKKLSVYSGSLLALLRLPPSQVWLARIPPKLTKEQSYLSLHYPTWTTVSHPEDRVSSCSEMWKQIIAIGWQTTEPPQLLKLLTLCLYLSYFDC